MQLAYMAIIKLDRMIYPDNSCHWWDMQVITYDVLLIRLIYHNHDMSIV